MRHTLSLSARRSDEVEHVLLTWVYPQRKQLAQLVQSGSLSEAEVAETIAQLTEAAAHTLDVARASVWSLRPDGSAIDCIDLYEAQGSRHGSGAVIAAHEAPAYFRALASEKVIAADDARVDPRTAEFRSGYLEPHGITSMLDAPVFLDGTARAVVCHEHVGPAREWQFWEKLVASTFADFVALVFEAQARQRSSARRQAYAEELERQVAERTSALSQSEQNLHALLDACPIPLVAVRTSDHQVVYANRRAFTLFEMGEQLPTDSAAGFWVDQDVRQAFLTRVLSTGQVHDLEVRLRKRSGQVFWARMDAQVMRLRDELMVVAGIVDVTEQRQAREDLRTVFASAPVAMVLSRLDSDRALACNQRAADLYGVQLEQMVGKAMPGSWVRPRERLRLLDEVQSRGRVDGFEAEMLDASGRRFWAELSAGVVQFDGAPALIVGGTDVSARKRAEAALRRSEGTLRTILDAAPNPLVVTGLDDAVVRYCNGAAAAMFELSVEELVGRRAPDFYVDPGDRAAFIGELHCHGRVERFTAQLRTAGGRPFWAILNAKTLDLEGEALFMCGFYDHSAQKELEDRLRLLATTDELTGAMNRRHFFEVAEAELHRAARYGHATSVAMIDVDHFKHINDQLGHRAGDAALRGLIAILRDQVRRVDLIARVGGEEFALLFPQTSLRGARRTLERIRALVAERSLADHGLPEARRITISVGLAEHVPGESLGDLLERADQGLYQAKAEGRDRVMVKLAR